FGSADVKRAASKLISVPALASTRSLRAVRLLVGESSAKAPTTASTDTPQAFNVGTVRSSSRSTSNLRLWKQRPFLSFAERGWGQTHRSQEKPREMSRASIGAPPK